MSSPMSKKQQMAPIGDDWWDEGDKEGVWTIALSPRGNTVVSGNGYGIVRLWDVETGKVITKRTGDTDSILSLCWSADGSCNGMSRAAKLSWKLMWVIKYSPNSSKIAIGGLNDGVKIWGAKAGLAPTITFLRVLGYVTQPRGHEQLARLSTGVLVTLSPISTHGLALGGIIGGHNGLIEADEQRDHTPTLDNDALLCSICANLDLYQFFHDGIPERDQEILLGSLSSILEKSYQCNFCRLISFHVHQARMLDEFPHVNRSGIECKLSSRKSGVLWTYFPISERFSCYHLNVYVKGLRSLSIHLMQEDAFKFGRPTDFDGRRVKNTVDATDNVDRKLLRFVRVVDVVLMAVIPAPSGCHYVALSYVWGGICAEYWMTKDNIVKRSTPGYLQGTVGRGGHMHVNKDSGVKLWQCRAGTYGRCTASQL
ncbi:hypothetical protein BDR05DRAFT_951862 [Suillus weaverae]|nr:hypothetical protein BDR05DRAFT_951862 [Suillus weaverae]